MRISRTDCKTEDGIITGLIDAIISICRILATKKIEERSTMDILTDPVVEALYDLQNDKDVKLIMQIQPNLFQYIEASIVYEKHSTEVNRNNLNHVAAKLEMQGVRLIKRPNKANKL